MAFAIRGEEASHVSIELGHGHTPDTATIRLKLRYAVEGGRCADPVAAKLFNNFYFEGQASTILPATDFFPPKPCIDVVFRGNAHAPGAKPCSRMAVIAKVAERTKRVEVIGDREARLKVSGSVFISEPQPFKTMPIHRRNAYGGWDQRPRSAGEPTDAKLLSKMMGGDHPGMYPRNPFGKGYVVAPVPDGWVDLPNLEDPTDLLTADNLIVERPEQWWKQPLPCTLDWLHPMMFPRLLHYGPGVDAWFPGPEDAQLPEVRRGYLPEKYRSNRPPGLLPAFYQGASLGMSFDELPAGTPLSVEGMNATADPLKFELPELPTLALEVEGRHWEEQPRVQTIAVFPNEPAVQITYALSLELSRVFIPEIHRHIPIACSFEDQRYEYAAPPTLCDRLDGKLGLYGL